MFCSGAAYVRVLSQCSVKTCPRRLGLTKRNCHVSSWWTGCCARRALLDPAPIPSLWISYHCLPDTNVSSIVPYSTGEKELCVTLFASRPRVLFVELVERARVYIIVAHPPLSPSLRSSIVRAQSSPSSSASPCFFSLLLPSPEIDPVGPPVAGLTPELSW